MRYQHFLTLLILTGMFGCQQKSATREFSFKKEQQPSEKAKVSTTINLGNKGVGPIQEVSLDIDIDEALAKTGEALYQEKCTACHKVGSTFIGPPPNGILKRRSPEWVMNMILNPDVMIEKDSVAKGLFMEFNGQLMTNQGLNESEARSILEFFRTLN